MEQPGRIASVLVVDDDVQVRSVIAEFIKRRGYSVTEAEDGLDAWQQLLRIRPDLIVSDLHMPRCDGREFCHRLEREPSMRDIPVLIVTGDFIATDRECLNCAAILQKPIVLSQLVQEIEHALELEHEPAPAVQNIPV
jgi:twitching motility two-component system response regulator PilH